MKVVAPSKKNEKNPPLLSTTLINRFEGNCDTFGKEGKNPIVINDIGLVCLKKKYFYLVKNNDHGMDVSMIIVI
jgi:hypothetical protein